jgi:uncharacterized protein (TIGR02217 family)
MAFHEVRFPAGVSLGSSGGPERRTEIVVLGSGAEERNSRWADSKRSYNAGYGVKGIDDLHAVIQFFEERRGRLHGFRWKDWGDYKSAAPNEAIGPLDQEIGIGDGVTASFQLKKVYGAGFAPWVREIKKPVEGTVVVAVDGVTSSSSHYAVNSATGVVTFLPGHIPAVDAVVSAELNLSLIEAGDIPNIPIVEIRL